MQLTVECVVYGLSLALSCVKGWPAGTKIQGYMKEGWEIEGVEGGGWWTPFADEMVKKKKKK